MNSEKRRVKIHELLNTEKLPLKGINLAERFNVTRQVIVKDIAILRAKGFKIVATPDGYIIPNTNVGVKKIVAVSHKEEEIEEELNIIVKYGGVVEDVIVEHPVYGEIKGQIMIKTQYDIIRFLEKIKIQKAEPLLVLTGGIHLHTISCENEIVMSRILKELEEKNYIISE
ncbi:MAG: transcription repressor NadR [Clostridiaceae bacterium]